LNFNLNPAIKFLKTAFYQHGAQQFLLTGNKGAVAKKAKEGQPLRRLPMDANKYLLII
jgi:hypothetical protein